MHLRYANVRVDNRGTSWRIRSGRNAVTALLSVVFAMTSLSLMATTREQELDVRIGKTVEISSSHRYLWFPTVHYFADGTILVGMRMSPDEWNPEGEFSAYCLSKDKGVTWSQRYTMGAGANADGSYTRFPLEDGGLMQLWNWLEPDPAGQAKLFHGTVTRYLRGGLDIEQSRDAVVQFAEPIYMVPAELYDRHTQDTSKMQMYPDVWTFGSIVKALNGDLLSTMHARLERDHKYYRNMLLRSSDGGKSWKQYSTISSVESDEKPWPGMGEEGPDETGIVRLADNRLYAIFRTGESGYLGQAWSSDDGKTWSRAESTPFKGVAPRIMRLSNGVLACTYGRPGPVTIMFSLDGTGRKWTNITPIFTGMSTRYTDLIEVEPGKVLVVYDSVPYGWDPIPLADKVSKNTIYGTFVEARRQ
jgi:hypothetical protein